MFNAWGHFVHRFRWAVLAISTLCLGISIVGLFTGGQFITGNSNDSTLQAARASQLINQEVNAGKSVSTPSGGTFLLIFKSGSLSASDPAFKSALEAAVLPLASDSRVVKMSTPYNQGVPLVTNLVSKDGHQALVSVTLRDSGLTAQGYVDQVVGEVRSPSLSIVATGNVPINKAFNTTLESDLQRAEYISLPVSLILLLLIFGAVVAASLPVAVGVLAILGGVAATLTLARFTDVSQYALNIVTLIGLGVAIDYSLFVVNRFREELKAGADTPEALGTTMATAGRAVTFSGITVAIGLSAMLFYRGTFLASMGAAGALVVFIAVLYGLTFLPAMLAVLGPRVDRWSVFPARMRGGIGFWHGLAAWVMQRPVLVLVPTLGFLIVLGLPFTQLRMANGDVDVLPPHLSARQGYDTLVRDFPGQDQNFYEVAAYYPQGSPLTADHVGAIYDLSRQVAGLHGVLRVESIVDLDPSLSRADYVRMYTGPGAQLPAAAQAKLQTSTGGHLAVLTVASNLQASSDAARTLLSQIRALSVGGGGGELLVTGQTAFDVDVIGYVIGHTPLAVGFVLAVTYLVLFLLTGSVVLPLKAIIANLLSVSASFGALVWIFQQGHLSGLLGFTPQSIDPTTPVILFSIVFGLSMDYEVLLVARIHEEYLRTGDNRRAVAEGLAKSGRLITGAAAIMVAVFLAFGMAEVVIIKAIGIGLAVAVALDATVVRGLVVPSVMRLLGGWNWWSPRPLRWLYRRTGLAELGIHGPSRPVGEAAA
ncbi:MAG TPA: MMPL family transporter [Candidatus Dormibacteraeota bacterium]|jgi:RND superfamily putative drug exporter